MGVIYFQTKENETISTKQLDHKYWHNAKYIRHCSKKQHDPLQLQETIENESVLLRKT